MSQEVQKLLAWMPVLTAFLIPIHPRFSSFTLALWAVVSLVCFIATLTDVDQRIRSTRLTLLFKILAGASFVYFCAICLGMLWTENQAEGWFALEVKFSFLLLPLLFWQVNSVLNDDWKNQTKRAFQWGLLVYLVWRFFQASWMGDWSLLRYDGFAGPFHPSYMALYLLTGILLSSSRDALGRVLLLVAGFSIGLLASKAGWGIGALIIAIEAVRRSRAASKDFRWLTGSFACLVIGAIWADGGRMQEFQSYLGRSPSISVQTSDGALNVSASDEAVAVKTGSTGGRMQAWRASVQLLEKHPFGVGTGDMTSTLAAVYEREGSLYAKKKNMNPHSIWLQAGVRLGWLAMLGMLVLFGFFAWKAIHLGAFQIAIWTLVIALNGTVESLFELQQGVVAILFLGLLFSSETNKEA